MTRQAFMSRLREGLRGLPPQTVAEITADYEAHFSDGIAAGRSEAEIAAALGDPDRLARELRAEASLKRWEEQRSPAGAVGAVFAVLGLGALDFLILIPLLTGVAGALFGVGLAAIGVFFAGLFVFAAGPFTGFPGGPAGAVLGGIGMMAAGVAIGAFVALLTLGLVNALVWYGRLHFRVLKPALEPQPAL